MESIVFSEVSGGDLRLKYECVSPLTLRERELALVVIVVIHGAYGAVVAA